MWKRAIVGMILVSTSASLVLAQRPDGQRRGGGRGMGGNLGFLLSQASVQNELKLSDEQRSKAKAMAESQRGEFRNLRDLPEAEREQNFRDRAAQVEKSAAELLTPEQLKRLKEISFQQQGVAAYRQPEVVSALGLTADQQNQIEKISEDAQGDATRSVPRRAGWRRPRENGRDH